MSRPLRRFLSAALVGLSLGFATTAFAADDRPNIIVILADDLGYADLGCQGSPDVRTPHIDSLAENGVRCSDGYVTAPQCAPARAGLLTGRYQNRFGFESNEQAYNPGLPLDEPILPERLEEAGYATGMMGKWGVSSRTRQHPPQRGFDVTFWNQDGNLYFPDSESPYDVQVHRGNEPVELEEYSTDAFAREAVDFIHAHANGPFFLYLPFVTPHVPMEAKEEDLARFPEVDDPLRRTFLAMMANLDDNIGRILGALEAEGIEDETLIFFLSDNGGYPGNASVNDPFRGTKSRMLEGGIRVPFLIQWKDRLPRGEVYENPVSSLDIAATAYAAAGLEVQPEWGLDGVNLIPYLTGKKPESPHDALYWRFLFPEEEPERHGWAIRLGDWKLVRNGLPGTRPALYDLENDPGERSNLIEERPDLAAALREAWEQWNHQNLPPAEPN